jgi:hypothetical protein
MMDLTSASCGSWESLLYVIVHTTNAPLYVIVINLLTEAFFYTVILYLGLFFFFVAHMSRCVCPHPSEYCLTGRVMICKRAGVHSQGQATH